MKCIFRHLSDLERVGWFQNKKSAVNKKSLNISLRKIVDWWIGKLVVSCHEQDEKVKKQNLVAEIGCS